MSFKVKGPLKEISNVQIKERGSAPSNPPAGEVYVYATATGLFVRNSAGTETRLDTQNVTGPGSSTDNAIARFDGTGGQTIQNSGVTIDDSNNIDTPGSVTATSVVTDTINEETAAAGVTVDGVLLKDSDVTAVTVNADELQTKTASGTFDFRNQGGTEVGNYTDAGAWSIGPSAGGVNHTINGGKLYRITNFSANQTNFNALGVIHVRVTNSATLTLNTITGTSGQILYITVASGSCVINHATGNIRTPTGGTITLSANDGATLIYDGANWRFVGLAQ